VSSSASGTASHTPVTFKNFGNAKRNTVINPNVRRKDMVADAFPLDNAVNKADEKILHPENKKLKEKIKNPFFVTSKTFLLFFANTFAIFSPPSMENKNTNMEIPAIKLKQIRTVFFSCFTFPLP
jgi:hypothetical protein